MARITVKEKIAARLPPHLVEFVQQEVDERGVDITVVIIDALNFYKNNKLSPGQIQNAVENYIKNNPTIIDKMANQVKRKLLEID